MSLTHIAANRNALADLIVDLIDGDAGNPNGQLIFMTSGGAEVATLEMSNPAFGAAAVGIATAATISSDR